MCMPYTTTPKAQPTQNSHLHLYNLYTLESIAAAYAAVSLHTPATRIEFTQQNCSKHTSHLPLIDAATNTTNRQLPVALLLLVLHHHLMLLLRRQCLQLLVVIP